MAVSQIVLDPSVVIKWYIPEEGSKTAEELQNWLVSGAHRMMVPTLFFDEITNILWKKETLKKETIPKTSKEIIWELLQLPLQLYLDRHELYPKALEVVKKTRITVYDAVYLVTAIQNQAVLITADKRLAHQVRETSFANSIVSLEDWENLKGTP